MGFRHKLEDRIRRKEAEITDLRVQIREAESYLQSLQDTLKMLSREEPSEASGGAEPSIREGGMVAGARDALRKHGAPMHVNELLRAIGQPVTRNKRAALGGSLAAYVRKKQMFTRPNPAMFGLVEFDDPGAAGQQHDRSSDLGGGDLEFT